MGKEYLFWGKLSHNLILYEMNSPEIENPDGNNIIRPVYPQTAGLTSRMLANLIKSVLKRLDKKTHDPLPPQLLEIHNL